MKSGHLRQTDRQNRTLSLCNFNRVLIHSTIYMHHQHQQFHQIFRVWGSNLPCYASHEIWPCQTDRQNRPLSLSTTSTQVSLHLSIYMHQQQQQLLQIFRIWDSNFPWHASLIWKSGHGRCCLPSWKTSAKPPAAANRSFLNFFKPLSGWGPASTSSQSLSKRPMLLGFVTTESLQG